MRGRKAIVSKLQSLKQDSVQTAIYDAAIELFAAEGFEETTVDEIAQAAGISRRTFFRYFETKGDLPAQSVVNRSANFNLDTLNLDLATTETTPYGSVPSSTISRSHGARVSSCAFSTFLPSSRLMPTS